MKKGIVKFFNEGKGFGFVTGEDGKDVFVHVTKLNGLKLRKDDKVKFKDTQGTKGMEVTELVLA